MGGEGGDGWVGWNPHVVCPLKVHYFVGCRLTFPPFVGKSQLIFLSLIGIFFLALSVASNSFSPFVARRLTPFAPS